MIRGRKAANGITKAESRRKRKAPFHFFFLIGASRPNRTRGSPAGHCGGSYTPRIRDTETWGRENSRRRRACYGYENGEHVAWVSVWPRLLAASQRTRGDSAIGIPQWPKYPPVDFLFLVFIANNSTRLSVLSRSNHAFLSLFFSHWLKRKTLARCLGKKKKFLCFHIIYNEFWSPLGCLWRLINSCFLFTSPNQFLPVNPRQKHSY